MTIQIGARTDIGLVRERNEDAFVVLDLASGREGVPDRGLGREGVLLVVCDGLGGSVAGDVASRMAASTLAEWIRTAADAITDVGSAAALLRTGVIEANRRIFDEAQRNQDLWGMGTTATAALVHGSHLVFAQVGDSRLYLLRGDDLAQLTRDQSLVVALLELGLLSSKQAETLQGLNVLLQAVGTEERVEIATCRVPLRRGDVVLLCSDGLTAVLSDADIAKILRGGGRPKALADRLVESACAGGGPDNVTVVVARVAGPGLEPAGDEKLDVEVIR